MLSDEEKKAISILKERDIDFDELYTTYRQSFIKPYDKSIGIVLNLIEKQQKEIEENKKWKDKIKAKIEELENMYNKLPINPKEHLHTKTECKIVIGELQSLLEKE